MGLDISAVFQKKVGDRWVDVSSEYDGERDYGLYDWLSGRHGSLGEPLPAHAGAPEGFRAEGDLYRVASIDILPPWQRAPISGTTHPRHPMYLQVAIGPEIWWLHLDEILAAPLRSFRCDLVVPIGNYRQWDGAGLPPIYFVERPGQRPADDGGGRSTPQGIHEGTREVVVGWMMDVSDHLRDFLDEMRRLKAAHGEVRMVFSFA